MGRLHFETVIQGGPDAVEQLNYLIPYQKSEANF